MSGTAPSGTDDEGVTTTDTSGTEATTGTVATDRTDAGTDVTAETSPPASNWGPTRLSLALALTLTGAVVVALVSRIAVPGPTAAGVLGGALLAGALWAGGRDRFRLLATTAESLLLAPVGLSLSVAVAGAVLLQYREAFPVATPSAIPAPTLRILATTGVVVGVALATLGALAATGDLLTPRRLRTATDRALRLGLPPSAVAAVLGALTVLSSPAVPPTVDLAVALRTLLGAVVGFLLDPDARQVPLGTLFGLLTVTAWAVVRLVDALPTAELAAGREDPGREWAGVAVTPEAESGSGVGTSAGQDDDAGNASTDGEASGGNGTESEAGAVRAGHGHAGAADDAAAVATALERVRDVLAPSVFLLASATLAVWAVDGVLGPVGLAERLGPGPVALLYGVATASALRGLLAGVVLVSLAVVLAAWAIRQSARARTSDVLAAYVPYAVGLGVVPVAFAVHGPVLGRGIPLVADLLSGFGDPFSRTATGVVAFYGGGVVLLALLGGALLFAVAVVTLLRAGVRFGVPEDDPAGPAMAGAGLLFAAGFLGAAGGPVALVVVGVAGAVLVRDLGRYGTVLGREVGRRGRTGRAEAVHAVGAVLVGAVATGLALALARAVTGASVAPGVPVQVPLLGALVGVALLVLALR